MTLGKAVDEWMTKLGLLAAVKPRERGKYGYELDVEIAAVKRPLDLTTVGVGVSQALADRGAWVGVPTWNAASL